MSFLDGKQSRFKQRFLFFYNVPPKKQTEGETIQKQQWSYSAP